MTPLSRVIPLALATLVSVVASGALIVRTDAQPTSALTTTPTPTATPRTPTKAEFLAAAEAICIETNDATIDDEWDSLAEGAEEIARFRRLGLQALDRLLALEPPSEDRELLETSYYSLLRDVRHALDSFFGQLETAVRDGDVAALDRLAAAADDAAPADFMDRVEALRAYGFKECMRDVDSADPAAPPFGPAPAPQPAPQLSVQFLEPMPRPSSASTHATPPTSTPTPTPLIHVPPR